MVGRGLWVPGGSMTHTVGPDGCSSSPPPTSGQCGPSRLFYPRRCHGSAASFSPTAGVEPPAFSPPHPPPFSLSTAPLSPLSLSRSEALSAHFALHLLTAAPTAPGGWGAP